MPDDRRQWRGRPDPLGNIGAQQYTFRNRLWEAELQRMAAIKQAEQEAQRLAGEARAARTAVTQAERSLGTFEARAPEQCREGAPLPLPERSLDAVLETEREPVAAAVCLLSTGQASGNLDGP